MNQIAAYNRLRQLRGEIPAAPTPPASPAFINLDDVPTPPTPAHPVFFVPSPIPPTTPPRPLIEPTALAAALREIAAFQPQQPCRSEAAVQTEQPVEATEQAIATVTSLLTAAGRRGHLPRRWPLAVRQAFATLELPARRAAAQEIAARVQAEFAQPPRHPTILEVGILKLLFFLVRDFNVPTDFDMFLAF